jgi:hypothetical protein
VPGASDRSLLVRVIAGLEPGYEMPPDGDRLSDTEIGILRAWIDQGIPGIEPGEETEEELRTDHWSFQPLTRPPLPLPPLPRVGSTAKGKSSGTSPRELEAPNANDSNANDSDSNDSDSNDSDSNQTDSGNAVSNRSGSHSPDNTYRGDFEQPIDYFIAARLREEQLNLSPPADRRTLIRRLYLDLLGILPSPEEVERFAASDDPLAYEQLVDRLLASPRYGERWGQHWLDVVRFAETNGFETNTPRPHAHHYRDYVIQALNADKPYDQFVREQIAGDTMGMDAATGFLVAGSYDEVKSPDVTLTLMQRQDELADMIHVTGSAFLGLTLGCARCHNHKFDPVPQRDFYGLQAVFAGVRHGNRPLRQANQPAREEETRQLALALERVEQQLEAFRRPERVAHGESHYAHYAFLIDDRDTDLTAGVDWFAEPRGEGVNPEGSDRGFRDDPGDMARTPNLSQGRYTWWQASPGQLVAAYRPNREGKHAIWVSWGGGWTTHVEEAEYLLDLDGDPETEDDQILLARVNQQRFADGSVPPDSTPLWSGLLYVGVHPLSRHSRILLRNGNQDGVVTADVVAVQQVDSPTDPQWSAPNGAAPLPTLRPPISSTLNVEAFPATKARWVRMRILAADGSEPCLDELEIYGSEQSARNLTLDGQGAVPSSSGDYAGNPKHRLEHLIDGRHGNSYSWISDQTDRGWVQVEFSEEQEVGRIEWGRDRLGEFRDRTATRYELEVATEPDDWQVIASSQQRFPSLVGDDLPIYAQFTAGTPEEQEELAEGLRDRAELQRRLDELQEPGPVAYIGQLEEPQPTHRLYRGDPLQPREEVAPGALSVLGSLDLSSETPEASRRAALARWLTSADNPLPARVMANRLWHYHFGQGLVATPSDFGGNGVPPSHPELLDWLAVELRESGWSLKHLHRLILTSSTYRQSSAPHEAGLSRDAEGRLLWRFPPRRLEAEAIRDNLLLVAGALDHEMFGPGFDAFEPNTNYVRVYIPRETMGPDTWRRMVYMTKVRMEQDAVFGAFDCPDAGQATPSRGRSTTAIQALNLLNSPFVISMAEKLAERVSGHEENGDRSSVAPADPTAPDYPTTLDNSDRATERNEADRRIVRLFELVLGRSPDKEELADARDLQKEHGLVAVCRAVLNSNEFLTLP